MAAAVSLWQAKKERKVVSIDNMSMLSHHILKKTAATELRFADSHFPILTCIFGTSTDTSVLNDVLIISWSLLSNQSKLRQLQHMVCANQYRVVL